MSTIAAEVGIGGLIPHDKIATRLPSASPFVFTGYLRGGAVRVLGQLVMRQHTGVVAPMMSLMGPRSLVPVIWVMRPEVWLMQPLLGVM